MSLKNYNHHIVKQECVQLSRRININNLKNKKFLVTGANGLIGSFLCDFLVFLNNRFNANIEIIGTSYSKPNKALRIKHLINKKEIKYFSWDCSKNIQEKLDNNIDVVIFCSGYGQPGKFLQNMKKTALINTVGPVNLLDHLNSQKIKSRFLFLSSSEIYGSPTVENIPTRESYSGDYDLNNKRECYKQSKKLGEVISKSYKSEKIDIKIARVGLTYGPGALFGDKRVMQEFIFKALKNETINMLDAGESLRNFMFITDAIEVILNILFLSKEIVYNVGNDQETTSIYELAKKIGDILNVDVNKGKSSLKNAPVSVYLSMEKYKKEFKIDTLNLKTLEYGIDKTVKWFNV
jgi:UDP-glucuronate decarboxylase